VLLEIEKELDSDSLVLSFGSFNDLTLKRLCNKKLIRGEDFLCGLLDRSGLSFVSSNEPFSVLLFDLYF